MSALVVMAKKAVTKQQNPDVTITRQHLSELLKQFELAFHLGPEYSHDELKVLRAELQRLHMVIQGFSKVGN